MYKSYAITTTAFKTISGMVVGASFLVASNAAPYRTEATLSNSRARAVVSGVYSVTATKEPVASWSAIAVRDGHKDDFVPKTALGKRLWELRQLAIKEGEDFAPARQVLEELHSSRK